MKNKKMNKLGFTLVEIIVALGIFGIVLVGALPAVVTSYSQIQYSRGDLGVSNAINQHIEYIRSLEFNQIGNVGGNPAGVIPTSEQITIGNREYTRTTIVNWVSVSESAPNTDYKSVSVRIAGGGFFNDGQVDIDKEVTTIFSRDSEQSPLTGGSVLVYVKRGWQISGDPEVPVQLPVQLGATLNTTDATGKTNFFNLIPDTYSLDVKANTVNMINLPSEDFSNLEVQNNVAHVVNAEVEFPSEIRVRVVDVDDNPVSLQPGTTGNLTLEAPFENLIYSYDFDALGSNGEVSLPVAWSKLWPVGAGYPGNYSLTATHPDYVTAVHGVINETLNIPWDGTFSNPASILNLKIVMTGIPTPPEDTILSGGNNWILGSGNSLNLTTNSDLQFNGIAYGNDNDPNHPSLELKPYQFNNNRLTTLKVTGNNSVAGPYYAASVFFEGKDLEIDDKAKLVIASNLVVFNIDLILDEGTATVELYTIDSDYLYDSSDPIDVKEISVPSAVRDMAIYIPGGKEGTKYGQLFLTEDVKMGKNKNNLEVIISKGAYFFPHGFNFITDYTKSPSEGGLIKR